MPFIDDFWADFKQPFDPALNNISIIANGVSGAVHELREHPFHSCVVLPRHIISNLEARFSYRDTTLNLVQFKAFAENRKSETIVHVQHMKNLRTSPFWHEFVIITIRDSTTLAEQHYVVERCDQDQVVRGWHPSAPQDYARFDIETTVLKAPQPLFQDADPLSSFTFDPEHSWNLPALSHVLCELSGSLPSYNPFTYNCFYFADALCRILAPRALLEERAGYYPIKGKIAGGHPVGVVLAAVPPIVHSPNFSQVSAPSSAIAKILYSDPEHSLIASPESSHLQTDEGTTSIILTHETDTLKLLLPEKVIESEVNAFHETMTASPHIEENIQAGKRAKSETRVVHSSQPEHVDRIPESLVWSSPLSNTDQPKLNIAMDALVGSVLLRVGV